MTCRKHKPAAMWIMELAASFDFCDKNEKQRVYYALCAAWDKETDSYKPKKGIMKLIKEILNLLLGYKYRAVILKDRGVERYWICSYVFDDPPAVNAILEKYLEELERSVIAHTHYETVSFRSRREYGGILQEKIAERNRRRDIALEYLRDDTEKMRRYTGSEGKEG